MLTDRSCRARARVALPVVLAFVAAVAVGCGDKDAATQATSTVLDITPPKGTQKWAIQPATSDPKEIVQRMVSTFSAHPTLFVSQSSDVETNLRAVPAYHQNSVMLYRANPVGIVLKVQDPTLGTHELWASDRQITHYTGLNQFTRDEVRAVRVLDTVTLKDYVRFINARAWGVLSPVDLVASKGAPTGLTAFQLDGEEVRRGRLCHVVTAKLQPAYAALLARMLFRARLPLRRGDIKMWVDKESFVLVRTTVELSWSGKTVTDDKHTIIDPTHNATSAWTMVPAPRYQDRDFRFVPPKGAAQLPSRK